jgi:RNA polymerase sigma-70 factor, ECF subfamily
MSAIDVIGTRRTGDETASGETASPSRNAATPVRQDREHERWVEQLRLGHPRRDQTVATLHEVLLRVAFCELSRPRGQLASIRGPELEDLAHQAADVALLNVLARLHEFRRLSRFTTWACKFVIFEVSGKLAQHAWRRQPPNRWEPAIEQLPDSLAPRPADRLEQQEQLNALSLAIRGLTERQREVFVAVALNDVPIDVLAIKLGTNRNAIYKNLFDARRNLRARMAAAGHPVLETAAA